MGTNKGKTTPEQDTFISRLFEEAKRLPEGVPLPIREELARLSAEVNGEGHDLKGNPGIGAEEALSRLKRKAISGLQKYIREGRIAEFRNNNRFQKILSNVPSFDALKAGDLLQMKELGANITNFLLSDENGDEIDFQKNPIENLKNKKILLNFGENKAVNNQIGLGDLLPHEVKKIKVTKPDGTSTIGILGSVDSRKGRKERAGYYDEEKKYIPVYSGYSIEILETGVVSEDEKRKFEELQTIHREKIRIDEMVSYITERNGPKKIDLEEGKKILSIYYLDDTDKGLFEKGISLFNSRLERGEYMRNVYKSGIGSQEKFVGKFGWYLRDVISKDFPNIPPYILVNLFRQESGFDPTIRTKVPEGTAYGLGQITDNTWEYIKEHLNNSYDRDSPYDQIHASAAYLQWIMQQNKCDITDALIYYHMGPNVKKLMESNDTVGLEKYRANNPVVSKLMTKISWQGYWDAARSYYLNQPGLITSLDLTKTGTELASQLGDYVMSTILPDTGTNSCGKAVGILLERFGIQGLPNNGRDGKNWDDILEPKVSQGTFKKVAIKHPDEASAGAILVYDGSGIEGSAANKNHGHAEIKGSDGKYYSYYEGKRPGGSAANNEKDPDTYRTLTGFTGYAYYPIAKQK